MTKFLTRKRDKQVFPVKKPMDSGSASFVGVDKSQIEKNNPEYDLEARYDSRKSFYGKAVVRTEDGRTILRSYNTDVAEITKDGKVIVHGTYSPTTLRHIKEFLKQKGHKAESSKQILKDYSPTKKDVEEKQATEKDRAESHFKSVAMVSSMGNIFCKTQKEKNEWKLRMLKAGLGKKGFRVPDDWDKLSENEKEKRLDAVIKLAGKDTDKDGVPDSEDCEPDNPDKQGFIHDIKKKFKLKKMSAKEQEKQLQELKKERLRVENLAKIQEQQDAELARIQKAKTAIREARIEKTLYGKVKKVVTGEKAKKVFKKLTSEPKRKKKKKSSKPYITV